MVQGVYLGRESVRLGVVDLADSWRPEQTTKTNGNRSQKRRRRKKKEKEEEEEEEEEGSSIKNEKL